MNRNTCTAVNMPTHLECQVCFDTWTNPVQLLKCGHIFCRNCAPPSTTRCTICNAAVAGFSIPSEGVIEASMSVPVLCTSCSWRGTRKASLAHQCDSGHTHSMYEERPAMTDREWVEYALQGRDGVVAAAVTRTTHQEALPSAAAIYGEPVTGIPL